MPAHEAMWPALKASAEIHRGARLFVPVEDEAAAQLLLGGTILLRRSHTQAHLLYGPTTFVTQISVADWLL
jgi:hypothetical protein